MLALLSTAQYPLAQASIGWSAGPNVSISPLTQNRPSPDAASDIATLTYAIAIDFFKKDMEDAPVTYVGGLFDMVLKTKPVQMIFRKLDQLGRFVFGKDAHTPKRSAFIVIPRPKLCKEGTVSFYRAPRGEIFETVNVTLALGKNCNWGDYQKTCVERHLGSYVSDRGLLEPYNRNDTFDATTWNYTHSSTLIHTPWVISCQGNFNLSNSFLRLVKSALDEAAACELDMHEEQNTTILYFGAGVAIVLGIGAGLTYIIARGKQAKIVHPDDFLDADDQSQLKEPLQSGVHSPYTRYGSLDMRARTI